MIFVIVGPTGSGKSSLAIDLALKFNGVILNGDAFQVYQDMNIGTAKPLPEDLKKVNHYLYDLFKPDHEFSIYEYQKILREEIQKHIDKNIIIVGGSGLYLKSALYDFTLSEQSQFDMSKFASYSDQQLYDLLLNVDKDSALKTHPNNRKRVLRALEIYYSLGEKKSDIEKSQEHKLLYDAYFIGYDLDRNTLYDRINKRVDLMVKNGLFEEVESLAKIYDSSLKSLQAIGYKEILTGLNDNLSKEEIIENIKKNSRHYAKRQMTYFKHQLNVKWINNELEAFNYVEELLKEDKKCN